MRLENLCAVLTVFVGMQSVLVVANRTSASPTLLEAVQRRAREGPCTFTLLVPRTPHGLHRVVDPEDHGLAEAQATIEQARPLLAEAAGGPVLAIVGSHDPLAAVEDAFERRPLRRGDHLDLAAPAVALDARGPAAQGRGARPAGRAVEAKELVALAARGLRAARRGRAGSPRGRVCTGRLVRGRRARARTPRGWSRTGRRRGPARAAPRSGAHRRSRRVGQAALVAGVGERHRWRGLGVVDDRVDGDGDECERGRERHRGPAPGGDEQHGGEERERGRDQVDDPERVLDGEDHDVVERFATRSYTAASSANWPRRRSTAAVERGARAVDARRPPAAPGRARACAAGRAGASSTSAVPRRIAWSVPLSSLAVATGARIASTTTIPAWPGDEHRRPRRPSSLGSSSPA